MNALAAALLLLLLLGGLCWPVARRVVPALRARFDGAVLRVEPPEVLALTVVASPSRAAQQEAWNALQAWCFEGAGDGRSPFWRPWVAPCVELRFAARAFALDADADADPARLVHAFMRHLDGSDQLDAAGGTVARLWLRLRVKRDDCLWWRERQPSDPWDCGYLVPEAVAGGALGRFQPRRASLIVAHGLDEGVLRSAQQVLLDRAPGYHHPVRLLATGGAGAGLSPIPTPRPAPPTPPQSAVHPHAPPGR